jgi:hypothetical protein
MKPLRIATLILAAMALFILWGAAHAGDLERCYRRCEKNNPPIPSPEPTRTATPPTRTIGKSCDYYVTTQRTITFPVQDEPTVLCIDPPLVPVPMPFLEVSTVNGGNASCAEFWMQMYSPTGAVSEPSYWTSQPGTIMARVPGRYYAFVVLKKANNTACSTLTVHVR